MADELEEAVESLRQAAADSGVSCHEAAEAADRLSEAMAAEMDYETMIKMIRSNPTLTWFEKWRITRKLKKEARDG